jgi:hypothetical protein
MRAVPASTRVAAAMLPRYTARNSVVGSATSEDVPTRPRPYSVISTSPVAATANRNTGDRRGARPGVTSWRAITIAPFMYALTAPTVSTMAAAAAAMPPAGPIATVSRLASGTVPAAPAPSTLTVAIARPRYRIVVIASAIAMTLGSCLAGLANLVVSGATASQPTNESIRVVAAWPTDGQPCGVNGVQFCS